jgi:amino acid transporter
MSVRGAAFIGIGSMVGAGIFALLGEAAVYAGSAVWLSFLLAGLSEGFTERAACGRLFSVRRSR